MKIILIITIVSGNDLFLWLNHHRITNLKMTYMIISTYDPPYDDKFYEEELELLENWGKCAFNKWK